MITRTLGLSLVAACGLAAAVAACAGSDDPAPGGAGAGSGGSGGSNAGGRTGVGGSAGLIGAGAGSGGSSAGSGSKAGSGTGGAVAGAAGLPATTGGSAGQAGSGGSAGAAGAAGSTGASGGSAGTGMGGGCNGTAAWPAADPGVAGPFATMTETNVGPAAGEGADGGAPVAFTLFRPSDLGASGLCHPVITWGNGTGSSPSLYKVLLNHLASHGFVVIASDSPNVAQGDPPPMVAGVTWVLEQNDEPSSPLYRRIDVMHVGATGHSQGGFATTTAAGDSHITTMAPLCGASQQRNLHGPAFIFCGGEDETVPCDNVENAFTSITTQPAMLAKYLTADHANWVTFRGTTPSPVEIATTAWMRVHLMNDTALRPWFYGADCKLCADDAWEVTQKNME